MTKKQTATTNIYVHKYNKNNYKCNSTGQQKDVESVRGKWKIYTHTHTHTRMKSGAPSKKTTTTRAQCWRTIKTIN